MVDETGKDDGAKQGMADDIVTRLQCTYPSGEWPCEECTFCVARAEIERLRAAGDALADSVETALTGYSLDIYQTLPAWREARRG